MTHYYAECPSQPSENEDCLGDMDRAFQICLSLSEEFGFSEVVWYDKLGNRNVIGDYGSKES